MAENDDFNLDLSYMDNADGQQQHNEAEYNYDDSAELYGDQNYDNGSANATAGNGANGDAHVKQESSDAAQPDVRTEEGASADTSGSRKRKERDDDEYSQTAQNMTPRQTSSTPVPSSHGGYGPQPTHALNIQQLGHNMSEEGIREWANAVGKEDDIEELKFDEFKPNGKSKGAVYVKFGSPEAAQLVKDYIANTVPKPPGKPAGYIVHYANANPYLRSGNNPGTGGGGRPSNRGGVGGGEYRGRGRGGFRGDFNRGGGGYQGGRGNYNNNNNMGGTPSFNQGGGGGGGYNNNGGMGFGGGFNNGMNGGFNNRGGGFNNRGGNRGGNMGGGFNNNRGGAIGGSFNQGGMMGGMGRGGMPGMPAMPQMPMMNSMMGMPGMFSMPNMMGGMQNRGGMMGGNNMMGNRGAFQGGQQGGMNKRPRMG